MSMLPRCCSASCRLTRFYVKPALLIWSCVILLYNLQEPTHKELVTINEKGTVPFGKNELVFLFILCSGKEQSGWDDHFWNGDRQLRQAMVLMKSVAALSQSPLRFIVVSDPKDHFDDLAAFVAKWPDQYRQRVRLEYHPVWYPPGRQFMRTFVRECCTEVLFTPDFLAQEDAVIYLDTDLIFMRPPEDLWNIFTNFTVTQVAAMSPSLFFYIGPGKMSKVPFFGSSGVNSGNILLNLTRMRQYPGGGWTKAILATFDHYRNDFVLGDQDIFNAHFSQFPDRLLELGCDWNFRPLQCIGSRNMCPLTNSEGASVIHGNVGSFVSGATMEFKVFFEAWESYQLGEPLQRLYTSITERLHKVAMMSLPMKCGEVRDIKVVLTHQLLEHIRKTEKR